MLSAVDVVGGDQPALEWTVLVVMCALVIAAMQGVIVMESAEPARISYKKWKLMLNFQALHVLLVLVGEIFAFVELYNALRQSVTWLLWIAPTLLVVALSEVILDTWFTLKMGIRSRLHWIPFSSIGRQKSRPLLSVIPPLLTTALSIVLIGWRQGWWLLSSPVPTNTARNAARSNIALSNGVLAVCMGWCILLAMASVGFIIFNELGLIVEGYPSLIQELIGSRIPGYFLSRNPSSYKMPRDTTMEHVRIYEMTHRIEHGRSPMISEAEKKRNLAIAPLHVGNAVIGPDRMTVYKGFAGEGRIKLLVVLFIEHYTILPVLICTLAATVQLHNKLDAKCHKALAELVNFVLIVSLVQISLQLKTILWGLGFVNQLPVHKNDRMPGTGTGEPDAESLRTSIERPSLVRQGESISSDGENTREHTEVDIGIDD